MDGPIFPSLTKLALPVVGASLVQMAYNMVDMIWIGRVGSNAVAAVGAAGMYLWLSNGIASLSKVGGQIKVAHSLGAGDYEDAAAYARSALQLGIFTGVLFGILAVLLHGPLIGFFNLNSPEVIGQAEIYLMITSGLVVFNFINTIMTGIITAMGNSQTPFLATCMGLGVNFLLDPVLIFGMGPFPEMGVAGAALATILAQAIVTFTLAFSVRKDRMVFDKIHLLQKPDRKHMATIVRIGVPMSLQSMIFTFISMIIARIIAEWGDAAVAVQKVGNQIESISWMTAEGFGTAMNAFIGQNYGAGKWERMRKGYFTAFRMMIVWGLLTTAVLVFANEPIFRLFITEEAVVPEGMDYLRIIGYGQMFMCLELMTVGAFAGMGKTLVSSCISITLTSARVPLALLFGSTALGLTGVWWALTVSSTLKGITFCTAFTFILSRGIRRLRENRAGGA